MPKRRQRVRIIGGEWRGRRIFFAATAGLRPTADRRRETLFNWLGQDLSGVRCLDLFAGTGALAFEVLSRGGAAALLFDLHPRTCAALQETARAFDSTDRVRVVQGDALAALAAGLRGECFDLVLVDPPFASTLASRACAALEVAGVLAPGARIYLETDATRPVDWPAHWRLYREQRTGRVAARLLVRD